MNQQTNAANKEQVKAAKKKEKSDIEEDEDGLLFILSDQLGRRFLWKLMSDAGVFRMSADNSGSWTYFNEGARSIGNKTLDAIMRVSPESFTLMLKEKGDY